MQGLYMVSGFMDMFFTECSFFKPPTSQKSGQWVLFLVAEGTFIKFFSSQEFFQKSGKLYFFAWQLDQHWEVLSQLSEKFNLA